VVTERVDQLHRVDVYLHLPSYEKQGQGQKPGASLYTRARLSSSLFISSLSMDMGNWTYPSASALSVALSSSKMMLWLNCRVKVRVSPDPPLPPPPPPLPRGPELSCASRFASDLVRARVPSTHCSRSFRLRILPDALVGSSAMTFTLTGTLLYGHELTLKATNEKPSSYFTFVRLKPKPKSTSTAIVFDSSA